MYNHEPQNYDCPFCRIVNDAVSGDLELSGIILSSETVTVFPGFGKRSTKPVKVLVTPNAHHENIHDLPVEHVPEIHGVTRAAALSCSYDSALHGEDFNMSEIVSVPVNERLAHAARRRKYVSAHTSGSF